MESRADLWEGDRVRADGHDNSARLARCMCGFRLAISAVTTRDIQCSTSSMDRIR
jgi:hypothetical protein